jgi:hypothetical protein
MCGGKRRCVRFGVPSNEQPEGDEFDEEGNVNVLDDTRPPRLPVCVRRLPETNPCWPLEDLISSALLAEAAHQGG